MKELTFTLDTINEAAGEFLSMLGNNKVVAFHGGMGAGKTTFIAAVCKLLAIEDYVSSPTFAIVNEYNGANDQEVFHFDFYRINDVEELLNIGITEYLYSGAFCFIEWPEIGQEILPDNTIHMQIGELDDGKRQIKFLGS